MRIHENWGYCGPCAAGRAKSGAGIGYANFATLNSSLPQELFLGERPCQDVSGVG
jgi:hypothetical protein